ncbi:MAG: tetratricopeptide repeat protein [bacterium]|nr:tetratricopeptide repeat protein [bacterium]
MLRFLTLLGFVLLGLAACTQTERTRSEVAESINEDKAAAREHMDTGNYDVAVEILRPHVGDRVRDPQVHKMLGECYWRLGDYAQATTSYENALRIDYSNSDTHLSLGEMLMEMGKIGRALTELGLAVQFGERAPLPYYNYGLALYRFGRVDDALAQWETAYQIDPANPDYSAALAMGYTGRDDVKALEHFERAAAFGAADVNFFNNYGLLLMKTGHLVRAGAQFNYALAIEPENESVTFNFATLEMRSGEYTRAAKRLEALYRLDEIDHRYRVYLAKSYVETRNYNGSVELLEEWVEAQDPASKDLCAPGLDEAFSILAMSYRGLGDLSRAGNTMQRAIELAPRNVIHLINYGVMLAENGNIEAAKAQWERALELEPENALARQNLSATAQ